MVAMADGDYNPGADTMHSAEFTVLRDLMLQTKDAVDRAVGRMDDEIATIRRDVVDIREKHADLDKTVAGVSSSFSETREKVATIERQHDEVWPTMRRISANGFMDRLQAVMGTVDTARGISVRALVAITGLVTSITTGVTLLGLNMLAAHFGLK
jgi:hypothetical protein